MVSRGPTGPRSRVLQIHPTRICNLACAHCYSGSGPGVRQALDEAIVGRVIDEASLEGYEVIGVSGGEPLLYEPLQRVLARAKRARFVTTVTTNGMLLNDAVGHELAAHADLVAISLDGRPDRHNRMRRSAAAFDGVVHATRVLRNAGAKFGVIVTVTRSSLPDLAWVAEFAASEGASLFQAHVLEPVGRGSTLYRNEALSERELTIAYLWLQRLARQHSPMTVQCDMTDAMLLRAAPERALATCLDTGDHLLAQIVSPLVLEPDGMLVPLQYGFDRRYAFGSVLTHALVDLKNDWTRTKLASFTDVCRAAWESLPSGQDDWPIVNWFERTYTTAKGLSVLPPHGVATA